MNRATEPIIIGIDPGTTGAAVILNGNTYSIHDLPVTSRAYLKNQSKHLSVPEFNAILSQRVTRNKPVILFTEQMQSLGHITPAKTLMGLAEISSAIETTIRLFCLYNNSPLFVRKFQPRTWIHWLFPDSGKRAGRKSEAKAESIALAQEIFWCMSDSLTLKKHHDRAEAMLIAFTGMAELSGCIVEPTLKEFNDLFKLYSDHRQDVLTCPARFTDIYPLDCQFLDTIKQEIEKRKEKNKRS
jgi:hypothetical protein